ncbi:hypothetical protein GGS24DRAFT_479416 [Hypoxylon argillaceum]|nr:hypothetical protein GGS24DRAFT_479416 [Hypoxylon argillaceum]
MNHSDFSLVAFAFMSSWDVFILLTYGVGLRICLFIYLFIYLFILFYFILVVLD